MPKIFISVYNITMPYKRSYRGRRYRRRKPRAITYGQIGSKLYRDVMFLKKKISLLNVEVKYSDFTANATMNTTVAPTLARLVNIDQGDTDVTRDGNSVKALHNDIRLRVVQGATPTNQVVRFLVVKQLFRNDSAIPDLNDVVKDKADILSLRNIQNSYGYQVLIDKLIPMNLDNKDIRTFKFHIKTPWHIKYEGASDANVVANDLLYAIYTDETTNPAGFKLFSRQRFVDN
jgi:hypothetical protein